MIHHLLRVAALKEYMENTTLLRDVRDVMNVQDNNGLVDIDKSWDGLFYILTGFPAAEREKAQPPFKWALFGDNVLSQDFGYGPAMYITAEQAKEVNNAIKDLSVADFKTLFLRSGLLTNNAIYPHVKWPDADDALGYYHDYFESLQEIYALAAQEDEAVITFIAAGAEQD